MEQVTAPQELGSASTNTTNSSDTDATDSTIGSILPEISATVSTTNSTLNSAMSSAVAAAFIPPVIVSARAVEVMFGPYAQMQQQIGTSAVAALGLENLQAPLITEIGRWQHSLQQRWAGPLQSIINDSLGISRAWLGQEQLWRSAFTVPSLAWWTDLDLWPTDGLVTSVMRSLDVVRPQLLDMSRTLDNLLDARAWLGSFGAELWRDLRHAGGRIAYWAVEGALTALARGDFVELAEFIDCWLDAAATEHRVEALVEALLEIDVTDYRPEDGHQLLDDLAQRVRELTTGRRRDNESLLGLRRGTGTITRLGREDLMLVQRPGHRELPLEDGILDRIQPDVDPRVVELVNNLPRHHRKIAMLKIVSGCSWSAAATQCAAPVTQGEVVRRRLTRHRDALPDTTDPWADLAADSLSGRRAAFGRLRPDVVVIDGATGIWP